MTDVESREFAKKKIWSLYYLLGKAEKEEDFEAAAVLRWAIVELEKAFSLNN